MSGELEGAVLEQALKDDSKLDPGTKHAAPRPSAPSTPKFIPPDPAVNKLMGDGLLEKAGMADLIEPVKFAPPPVPPEEVLPTPTSDLPAGMKMALWVPIKQGDGTTIFQCSIEGFGYKATATSRVKQRALAFALEDMARQMIEAAT